MLSVFVVGGLILTQIPHPIADADSASSVPFVFITVQLLTQIPPPITACLRCLVQGWSRGQAELSKDRGEHVFVVDRWLHSDTDSASNC